jgi:hypothetical protein
LLSISSSASSLILIFAKRRTYPSWSCISLCWCRHIMHFICSILWLR